MAGLLWPARRYVVTRHPQGNLAAPLGAYALNLTTGAIYRKLGGASTQFGWYLEPDPTLMQAVGWQPRGNTGIARGIFNANIAGSGGPTTIINGAPFGSVVAAVTGVTSKQWAGGYTTAGANNAYIYGPAAGTINEWPLNRSGAGPTLADSIPWDLTWEVLTTPRSNNAANVTSLAAVRILAGVMNQSNAIQLSGGLGNSDALYTEFNSLSVNNGMYAAYFRFSTAAGDLGWNVVTANDNGAVATQTVTPVGVAIAVDTIYKLRLRFQRVAGVPTIFGSVNDGAEVTITGNVGPGTTPAGTVGTYLVPYLSIRTLAAALKSICFSRQWMTWGLGNEA